MVIRTVRRRQQQQPELHADQEHVSADNGNYTGLQISHAIDNLTAAFVSFSERPGKLGFGQPPNLHVVPV
jgi:hypothetical protein